MIEEKIPYDALGEPEPLNAQAVMPLPYADDGVHAGFPSPAQDYMTESIDLNEVIVKHRECTFYARVCGDSMRGAGIFDGDLVVIDKSLEARDGAYVVACIDGEFTLKRYRVDSRRGCVWLVPANKRYRPIRIDPGDDSARCMIWGVVTHSIRKFIS